MSSYHVSKSEFSRMAGVTPAAVATNSKLKPAFYGKRIDVRHPAAIAYLESRNIDASQFKPTEPKPVGDRKATVTVGAAAKKEKRKGRIDHFDLSGLPDDLIEWFDCTIREVYGVFGTDIALRDFGSGLKSIGERIIQDIKIAEQSGKLIPRAMVKKTWIDPVNECHRRLILDAPGRMFRGARDMVKSNATNEEGEAFIRTEMERFLMQMQNTIKNHDK